MPARLPTLAKSCFALDPRPLKEPASPNAGVLAISRVYRALRIPELVAANLQFKQRQRGFEEAQMMESIIMLQAVGGDCPEDIPLLHQDPLISSALGYSLPKVTSIRSFLEKFHDEKLDSLRPPREEQKSFIFPSSEPIRWPGSTGGSRASASWAEPSSGRARSIGTSTVAHSAAGSCCVAHGSHDSADASATAGPAAITTTAAMTAATRRTSMIRFLPCTPAFGVLPS